MSDSYGHIPIHFGIYPSKNGIENPAVEQCIQLLQKSDCIKEAAQKGTELIKKNCRLFNSREIEQLFLSMIPEVYK